MAGLVVFPLLFALGLEEDVVASTVGALFVTLPQAFATMGGRPGDRSALLSRPGGRGAHLGVAPGGRRRIGDGRDGFGPRPGGVALRLRDRALGIPSALLRTSSA